MTPPEKLLNHSKICAYTHIILLTFHLGFYHIVGKPTPSLGIFQAVNVFEIQVTTSICQQQQHTKQSTGVDIHIGSANLPS